MNIFANRFFVGVMLALTLGSTGCRRAVSGKKMAGGVTERWVHGVGYVEPAGEVQRLAFKNSGIVGHRVVDLGQRVAADAVLVALCGDQERAALAEAEAAVALARAQLAQVRAGASPSQIQAMHAAKTAADADAAYSRQAFARQEELARSHASTRAEYDLVQSEMRRKEAFANQQAAELSHLENYARETDVAVAEARVRAAEARLAMARVGLAETELRAPSAGTVLEWLRLEGEATMGSANDPALIFADLTRLRVRAEIDETHALELHAGLMAVVGGPALGARELSGRVAFVKALMGKKTVFAQSATERKDLDALQILIELPLGTKLPVGLEVDVRVNVGGMGGGE